jgi:hypothetical protein
MSITKQSLSLAVIFAVCGLLLASCGGASGNSASTASRNLPPDPGSTATATLTGVDTNANGVRDEVENKLSSIISDDTVYSQALKLAKVYQQELTVQTKPDADILMNDALCLRLSLPAQDRFQVSFEELEQLTFDTADRQAKHYSYDNMFAGVSSSVEPDCSGIK